jgi:hypothetical protein
MKILAVAVALIFVLSALAFAGNNPGAKCAVHVQAHNAKQTCDNLPVILDCTDIVTTYAGCNLDAFPVFFSLVAWIGFEYGMCWAPVECFSSCTFTSCSPLTIGDIKWSGDGISQTWYDCSYAWSAVPGWGWLYAYCPGHICICPHPTSGIIWVLDCEMPGGTDWPICNFCAGVCGAFGDDPCDPTGVEPSTWGGIKSMFE